MDNQTIIQALVDKITQHNEAYRKGFPIVSDREYDAEVEKLREIDPANEWFTHIEPVNVSRSRKIKLPIPMKSLNKVKDMKSLQNWIASINLQPDDTIVITPKFDGLSLLHNEKTGMTYSRGGSENEGQDCTVHYRNAKYAYHPSYLEYTYGEFVFNKQSWNDHFVGRTSKETGDKYKSPRNTAAGFLNRDQPCEELQYVDFYRYGTDEQSLMQFDTYLQFYNYLSYTFHQPLLCYHMLVKDITEEDLIKCFQEFNKSYYIDGLVLYANDLKIWKRVGRQENTGNPNYAMAYKNPDFTDVFTTTVKSVNWKINKAGALKPVVNIDIIDTGDCEMENPTGYNAKFISENKIAPGAVIKVTRSGGVIPKILQTITPATKQAIKTMWDEITECPECHGPMSWNTNKIELCCTNPHCKGVKLAKIIFFYTTIGVDNMGEETIAKMFNAGFDSLQRMLDISFDELLQIDSFGEATANVILANNKKIRQGIEVSLLMHASDCFQGIGQIKAQKILFKLTPEDRYSFIHNLKAMPSEEEIRNDPRFPNLSKTDQAFMLGINPFYQFVAENRLIILPLPEPSAPTNNRYAGVNVCFTGIRDQELEDMIIAGGGKVCSGVSKKTTHLIVADLNTASSKATKAKSLGIPIFTLDAFKTQY